MGNGQWATDLLSYTATATQEASGYPATNVGPTLVGRPLRTWRSTNLTAPIWQLDLGSNKVVQGLYLHNGNFGSVIIEASTNGTTWSDVVYNGSIGVDVRVGRRKRFLSDADLGVPINHRYLRVRPSGAVDGSVSYFELGALAVLGTVVTLTRNPNAWDWTRVDPRTVTEYFGGGFEVNNEGVPYLLYRLGAQFWTQGAALTELVTALAATGPGGLIVVHENRGDRTRAALCQQIDPVSVREDFWTFDSALALREAI